MKKWCVTYNVQVIGQDTVVEAETEKEAREKFKAVLPFEEIDQVWEVHD